MKLLLIEDDSELVIDLRHFLRPEFKIDHAAKGRDSLILADRQQYEAIIIDLDLPDIPGLEVCKKLRQRDIQTPILALCSTNDSDTRIALFETGADAYLIKPFPMNELKTRLLAMMRRIKIDTDQYLRLLQVGDLSLDPISGRVERSGKTIQLRRKEFGILEYMMRNKNKIVTKTMIMDNVWEPGCLSWEGTVNVHIKRLRDQIDRPYDQKLIKTAYGLGYIISDTA